MDGLFENSGRKLKSLAIVMFIVILIVGFVISYSVAQETVYAHWDYVDQTNGGKLVLGIIISLVIAYISALSVYAFGDLVENSKITAEILSKVYLPKEEVKESTASVTSTESDHKYDHIEPIFKDASAEESESIDPMEKLGV